MIFSFFFLIFSKLLKIVFGAASMLAMGRMFDMPELQHSEEHYSGLAARRSSQNSTLGCAHNVVVNGAMDETIREIVLAWCTTNLGSSQ